jgi:general secretion pathway protein N
MTLHRPSAALAAAAAALLLLLAAEWIVPADPPVSRQPPAIPAPAPDARATADIGEWADVILARPIFSPDRRPAALAAGDAAQPLPRLSAIIIAAGIRCAVFSTPGEKPLLLGPGGEVGGYRLQAITANSVAMLGPDGSTMTLRPKVLDPAPDDVANSNP